MSEQGWRWGTLYERLSIDQEVRLGTGPASVFGKVVDDRPYKGEAKIMWWDDDRTYNQQWFLYDQFLVQEASE